METSTARSFYGLQLACLLLWWCFVRVKTRLYPHELSSGPVFTRPSWMHAAVVLELLKRRVWVYAALPAALSIGLLASDSLVVRVGVAIAVSVYHLVESASTTRHGEFPLLYTAWAVCLSDDALASGATLGVVVHFVLCSGVAKLRTGGMRWLSPSTMRVYLDLYRASQSRPPLSRALNAWLAKRAWATSAIAVGTIVLECLLVPSTLLAPGPPRVAAALALIGLHLGIALVMSMEVGIVFVSTIAAYIVGFSSSVAPGAAGWALATAIGLGPTCASLALRTPLPESWPSTAVALFMFNGEQAARIATAFMVGDTRLVLTTSALAARHIATRPLGQMADATTAPPLSEDAKPRARARRSPARARARDEAGVPSATATVGNNANRDATAFPVGYAVAHHGYAGERLAAARARACMTRCCAWWRSLCCMTCPRCVPLSPPTPASLSTWAPCYAASRSGCNLPPDSLSARLAANSIVPASSGSTMGALA